MIYDGPTNSSSLLRNEGHFLWYVVFFTVLLLLLNSPLRTSSSNTRQPDHQERQRRTVKRTEQFSNESIGSKQSRRGIRSVRII